MAKKYTKAERMAIAQAFQDAKQFLWDGITPSKGMEGYICFALNRVSGWRARKDAKRVVMSRLDHCETVKNWLRFHGHLPSDSRDDPFDVQQLVQDYRIRWLNALIKEFRS